MILAATVGIITAIKVIYNKLKGAKDKTAICYASVHPQPSPQPKNKLESRNSETKLQPEIIPIPITILAFIISYQLYNFRFKNHMEQLVHWIMVNSIYGHPLILNHSNSLSHLPRGIPLNVEFSTRPGLFPCSHLTSYAICRQTSVFSLLASMNRAREISLCSLHQSKVVPPASVHTNASTTLQYYRVSWL